LKPYYEEKGITIFNCDCREVLPSLDYVFFCLTDPPFGTGELTGGYGRAQNHGGKGRTIIGDEDLSVLQDVAPLLYKGIGEPGWLITFCAPRRMLETGRIFEDAGFNYFGELVWDKGAPGLGFTIRYAHESLLVFKKGNAERDEGAIISVQRESVDRTATQLRHPHEKPVSILKSILMLGNGLVLDPFMGSGSVLRAAKDLGRKAIGIEIEERYCEMACKRLKQETLEWV
jgi:DNA modification methylase